MSDDLILLHALLFGPSYSDLPAALCQGLLQAKDAGGLTLREAVVMHAVLTADVPPTVNEIAVLVGAPQPSVSRCLTRLEKMGLIQRAPGLRRRQHISPSLSARELIE